MSGDDVYETPNKMTGAYSMGVYGIHPFVLLNFVNSSRDVSTIAHELGHSMHSYYAKSTTDIVYISYIVHNVNKARKLPHYVQKSQAIFGTHYHFLSRTVSAIFSFVRSSRQSN